MKILFFNLGTIEHRVLSWEVEGFKSLFEQDIILWGPVPDSGFEYNGKQIPILRVFEETSVAKLFQQLPEGWYPDIITCDTSAISYVPDIYKCPVKTLIFTRDSWSDSVFNRGLVEMFDFLNSSTVDRLIYDKYRINILPLRGFAVSTPGPGVINSKFEKRDIDVVAIANYDNSFYHERHKIFYRLAESAGGVYDIRFLKSIRRSEIYSYYQRSKIVIDWAHTLSNRSYEAALNGCLLFSHEDNTVMSDFWKPWEEYIPYNEENLPALIRQYLENPDLSARIAGNAFSKISRIPATWGEMAWDRICAAHDTDVDIDDRIRYNETISKSKLYHRTAIPLLYNYDYGKAFPQNWKELYFERIDKAIAAALIQEEKIQPLIDAARLAFLLGNYKDALFYLENLHEILPDYSWIHYLRARISFVRKDFDGSFQHLSKALACNEKAPELVQKYVMPVIEKGNACDGRRITDYMWQSIYCHANEYQSKALVHLSHELYGYIHEVQGEKRRAIESYLVANRDIQIPDCLHRICPLLAETGEHTVLSEVAERGLADSPYDNILALYRVYGLIGTGQRRLAARAILSHMTALKCFKGIRQIRLIRVVMGGLVPLIFISVKISSLVIITLATRIKKKAGFVYLGDQN